MQASQDINVAGRFSRAQYQFNLQDGDLDELDHWAPILLRALQGIRCCATSRPTSRSLGRPCGSRSTVTRHHDWASPPRPSTTFLDVSVRNQFDAWIARSATASTPGLALKFG
jgi:hypothetical protein